jgi:hypothetical protein
MTNSIFLAALVAAASAQEPASGAPVYVYLKPSVAPVPASCLGAKAVNGLVQVPLFEAGSRTCPVARVGGDFITVQELAETLADSHEPRSSNAAPQAGQHAEQEFAPALERMIQVRLLAAEAEEMGLGDLPEAKKAIDEFEARALRAAVQARVVEKVVADPVEVERLYKNATRESKVKSILFEKEADARAFVAARKAGQGFDELAKQAVADKKAQGGGEGEYLTAKTAVPRIAAALAHNPVGYESDAVQLTSGWVVFRIDDIRYPDSPKARAEAVATVLASQKRAALASYYEALTKKYAKIDRALLKKLDWEAKKPGAAALAKDKRPVVTIQGEKPITVADLTAEVTMKFFHGLEGPIREKRVNKEKTEALQSLLVARLLAKEGKVLKLQETEGYRRAVADYRRAVLLAAFVSRVLSPGVKVTEEDAMRYFDQHKSEYSYPQMYKLEGIAFTSSKGAQSGLDRLKAGTDFQWLRANADGQVKAEARSLPLDAAVTLAAPSMPPGLVKALVGSATGDYRLFTSSDSQYYVIHVVESIPSKVQPYAEAREAVATAVYDEKVLQAIKDYADKLRPVRQVEVFVTRIGS